MGEYKKLREKLKAILKQQKHHLSEKQIKELHALNFYYETARGSCHPKLIYYFKPAPTPHRRIKALHFEDLFLFQGTRYIARREPFAIAC